MLELSEDDVVMLVITTDAVPTDGGPIQGRAENNHVSQMAMSVKGASCL